MKAIRTVLFLAMLAMMVAPAALAVGQEGGGCPRADATPIFSRMELPFGPDFSAAASMPDGSSMLAVGPDGWLARYYAANRTFVDVRARGAARLPDYSAVAISPDTSEALIVGEGGMAVTVTADDRVSVVPTGTQNDLFGVSFTPDGASAWITGANRTLVEFDAAARKMTVLDDLLLPALSDIPADTTFGAVAFGAGTQYGLLAAPEAGRMFRLSDMSLLDITYKFEGLGAPACIAWSPDGLRAFVADRGPRAYLWDAKAETCARLDGPPGTRMVLAAWRDAGTAFLLATGTAPGLHVYSGPPALEIAQPIDMSAFRAMVWNPAGTEAIIIALDGQSPVAYGFRNVAIPRPSTPVLSDINATAVWLTWSWSPGDSGERLDHYILLYSISEAELPNATPLNADTNTSGRLYNLVPSTRYYLLIRVVTQGGLMADSETQNFSTAAIAVPRAVSLEVSGYRLQWRAATGGEVSKYDLYYSQRPGLAIGEMAFVATRPAGSADYTYDLSGQLGATVREGVSYYFRVRTVNRDGGTADSNEAEFVYNNPPPAVSAGAVTDITYNSVRLSWGKSSATDFSAYIIEYRVYPSGTWKTASKVTDCNTTSVVVGSLESDTRYDFRIKVEDRGGRTSTTSQWAVHPRTDENIFYEIFSTVFGDPVVCLPVSFMLLFMTAGAAAGMAKARKPAGAAVFGTFAAGFALLVVANLLSLVEVFQFTSEQKLALFLLPVPFAAAIAIARRARRARREARSRAESERRMAEERAAAQHRRAEEVRASLSGLGPRLVALEALPGQIGAPAARALLQQAGYALSTGDLDSARELAKRAETGIREMEISGRDQKTQSESIGKRLETLDSQLRTLIDHWLRYDPAGELGLDPLRIDRTRLDAARKDEDAQLQSAQAKQQQAGVLLGQGRLSEARDIAALAQAEVDRIFDFWNGWNAQRERATSLSSEVERAASWASIDSRAYRRRVEEARLALAVQDGAAAAAALDALKAELGSLGGTHRPNLAIGLPARDYRLNRFEDFQFTVRNVGKALASKIDIALEAPADLGPGGGAPVVKLVSMAPGGSQDCRLNLCFTREGSVPVLFSPSFDDHAGNRIVQEPVRLTVNVLGR